MSRRRQDRDRAIAESLEFVDDVVQVAPYEPEYDLDEYWDTIYGEWFIDDDYDYGTFIEPDVTM